jgi:ABC-type lipoprotein release transport system permease subunit
MVNFEINTRPAEAASTASLLIDLLGWHSFGLLLVAAVASCIPALRLRSLNPAETLRHE